MEVINNNLARSQEPDKWVEILGFSEDSGWELSTLYTRALGSIERAFKQGTRVNPELGFSPRTLPVFNVGNRLRITIEILGPETKSKAAESSAGASGSQPGSK